MNHSQAFTEIMNHLHEQIRAEENSKQGLSVSFLMRWMRDQRAAIMDLRDTNDPFWRAFLEILDKNLMEQDKIFSWSFESQDEEIATATKAKVKLIKDLQKLQKIV